MELPYSQSIKGKAGLVARALRCGKNVQIFCALCTSPNIINSSY